MNIDLDKIITLDCEVYPNYFLAAFKSAASGKVLTVEAKDSKLKVQDRNKLKTIMMGNHTYGFNSNNYDIPIIVYAMRGATCGEIYDMSQWIIKKRAMGWQTIDRYNLYHSPMRHFDIMNPAPGIAGLKMYGARMHSKKLQDLPIPFDKALEESEVDIIKKYCINDLDTTIDLYNTLEEVMVLRMNMSNQYDTNLLSKSDAQIAEALIRLELKKTGHPTRPSKTHREEDNKIIYEPPSYIKFVTPQLQDLLEDLKTHTFKLKKDGKVEKKETIIKIGDTSYTIGVGGMHSKEKNRTVIPTEDELLINMDAASYYPMIILNLGLLPKHLEVIYKNLVKRRLLAKRKGDEVTSHALKIVINGTFGKLSNKYSVLYSPKAFLSVTLTGQLALCMLIESLEQNGISVISGNTDGFVSLFPKEKLEVFKKICTTWERDASFSLESGEYKAMYSQSVNSYFVLKKGGEMIKKGVFRDTHLDKTPKSAICTSAVIKHITDGTPIEDTIRNDTHLSEFLNVRKVTGGAVWRGELLGKVVRWIYVTDGDKITYVKNGNKVPTSDGCRPLMNLTGGIPGDIDYDKYIQMSHGLLNSFTGNLHKQEHIDFKLGERKNG
jgi:hypothetical protein